MNANKMDQILQLEVIVSKFYSWASFSVSFIFIQCTMNNLNFIFFSLINRKNFQFQYFNCSISRISTNDYQRIKAKKKKNFSLSGEGVVWYNSLCIQYKSTNWLTDMLKLWKICSIQSQQQQRIFSFFSAPIMKLKYIFRIILFLLSFQQINLCSIYHFKQSELKKFSFFSSSVFAIISNFMQFFFFYFAVVVCFHRKLWPREENRHTKKNESDLFIFIYYMFFFSSCFLFKEIIN